MHALEEECSQDVTDGQAVEAGDLLEIYCYLACMGPDSFEHNRAMELITSHSGPQIAPLLGSLLDPGRRIERSQELGHLLAENLASRKKDAGKVISALLPALVDSDIMNGFSVLKNTAAAVSPPIAKDFSEVLLSLTIAGSGAISDNGSQADTREESRDISFDRLRYLLSVMTSLNLGDSSRTHIFLALSQAFEDGEIIRDIVLSSLFPSGSSDMNTVIVNGNDMALRAMISGAASRPNGKAEFYSACRSLADLGLGKCLPVLARVYRLLNDPDSGSRALASMVRAAVLLSLETSTMHTDSFVVNLPPEPDLPCLDLLTIVAPGLKDPHRTDLCNYLIDGASALLMNQLVPVDDCEAFVQVVVGASVLHDDPAGVGKRIRGMLLDAAGALHVRVQSHNLATNHVNASEAFSAHPFHRIVDMVSREFNRRENLSTSLESVIPLITETHGIPAS